MRRGKTVAERVQAAEPIGVGPGPARSGQAVAAALTDLSEAPSLLIDRAGLIMRATLAAAAIVGTDDPDKLVGRNIQDVLLPDGERYRLTLGEGAGVPVRAVRWRVPTTGMDAVLLSDESAVVAAAEALQLEHRRFDDAQRLAQMGW